MDLRIDQGTTSKRISIFIPDAQAPDGEGLAGLVYNSATLTWTYWREDEGNAAGTAVTLATATRGTWSTGGFVEKDATLMPGWYEIGVPNAALASGAKWVVMTLRGAANMVPCQVRIQLDVPPRIQKNVALSGFTFPLFTTAGAPATGITVTATRSIDGAALGACANSVSELSGGYYKIDLAAADLNGSVISLRFTGTGAVDTDITLVTQG